ncbi:MAG: monovalent cation/H+ antiporter complex subunit F [Pseudomonadota bacterium]
MFAVATFAVVAAMAVVLARAFAGPTLYDRVLAGNSFGTKTVILIGLMGFLMGRPDFLDIAILYALLNFASLIAILKFFRYRTLSVSMQGAAADRPVFEVEHEAGAAAPSSASSPATGKEEAAKR